MWLHNCWLLCHKVETCLKFVNSKFPSGSFAHVCLHRLLKWLCYLTYCVWAIFIKIFTALIVRFCQIAIIDFQKIHYVASLAFHYLCSKSNFEVAELITSIRHKARTLTSVSNTKLTSSATFRVCIRKGACTQSAVFRKMGIVWISS